MNQVVNRWPSEELSDGTRVILSEGPCFGLMGATLVFGRGCATGEGLAGAALAAFEWVERGTRDLDRSALNAQWEQLGGRLRVQVSRSSVSVSISGLVRNQDRLLQLAGDVLCEPRLDPQELRQVLTDIDAREAEALEDADGRVSAATPWSLWAADANSPDTHARWHTPVAGRHRDRQRLRPQHLMSALASVLSAPARAGIWGDEPSTAVSGVGALLERIRKAWGHDEQGAWTESPRPRWGRRVAVSSPSDQAAVCLYFEGPGAGSPDWTAFDLLVSSFGGGFRSPLVQVVRSERGLSYDAHASIQPGRSHSWAMISGAPRSSQTGLFVDAVEEAWKRHTTQFMANEQLQSVVRYLRGTDMVAQETARARLGHAMRALALGTTPLTPVERSRDLLSVDSAGWGRVALSDPFVAERFTLIAACHRGAAQRGWGARWDRRLEPLRITSLR